MGTSPYVVFKLWFEYMKCPRTPFRPMCCAYCGQDQWSVQQPEVESHDDLRSK